MPLACDATVARPCRMASSKAACWPGVMRMSAISRIMFSQPLMETGCSAFVVMPRSGDHDGIGLSLRHETVQLLQILSVVSRAHRARTQGLGVRVRAGTPRQG